MIRRKLIILLIVAVLLSGCTGREGNDIQGETPGPGFLPGLTTEPPPETGERVVKAGDIAVVDYVGVLEDGEVFDTSDEETAKAAGIYAEGRNYKPLTVNVGAGEVIKGFEEGIKGMKVDGRRRITILPEYAYGEWDQNNVKHIPWVEEVPAKVEVIPKFNLSREEFLSIFGQEPHHGDVFPLPELPWNGTVVEVGEGYVTLGHVLGVGEVFSLPPNPWNATVDEVTEEKITLRFNAIEGEVVRYYSGLPWDTTVVNVTEDFITLHHNAFEGGVINGIKITPREEEIELDLNHPLAGKTLVFDIKVIGIYEPISWFADLNKAQEEALSKNKNVVLYFTTEWCNLCKRLDSETLRDPLILEVKDNFVWTKVDAEVEVELAKEYGADAYPMLIFMNSRGDKVGWVNWFLSGEDLRSELDKVTQNS